MGLADPAEDLVSLVRHVRHIQRNYWSAGLALSLPRLCAQEGGFSPLHEVTPRVLAAGYMALRCVFPEIPLVLSTRESARFRDGMSQVCITRMSVASRTEVGGYGAPAEQAVGQFEVSDTRTVADFCDALRASDIEPMFKNWDAAYRGFADSPGKSTP